MTTEVKGGNIRSHGDSILIPSQLIGKKSRLRSSTQQKDPVSLLLLGSALSMPVPAAKAFSRIP
jgi:hypothetical protein